MSVITLGNLKGGCAKTTSVRALGDLLSERLRVLMVDSDHQGSLSKSCKIFDPDPCLANVYGVGGRKRTGAADVIQNVSNGLDIIPASIYLAAAEDEIQSRDARDHILSDALEGLRGDYDLILIDTPPALGKLVTNALCASDSVIVPSIPQYLDIAGVQMFLSVVDRIRTNKRMNPGLTLFGVLLTMYDKRLNTHKKSREQMLEAGWPVLPMTIPRSIRAGESPAAGESIVTYEPESPVALAYRELSEVVYQWQKTKS